MFAALGRTYEGHPSPAVFGTHLILYSRASQMSTLKYHFPQKVPANREKGPGENLRFSPVDLPKANQEIQIIFGRTPSRGGLSCPVGAIHLLRLPKIPRPARPRGAHTSDRRHWWWGGSEESLLPSESPQISFAVFIFTPGPMVEAATQLRIYWPLAAAGLALTIAPMRAL